MTYGRKMRVTRKMLRVKQVLITTGITQSELAETSGLTKQAVCRIVNGQEQPWPKRGKRIADALNWGGDWEELFEWVFTSPQTPGVMPCARCGDMPFSKTSEKRDGLKFGFTHECPGYGTVETLLFPDEKSARIAWNALITGKTGLETE